MDASPPEIYGCPPCWVEKALLMAKSLPSSGFDTEVKLVSPGPVYSTGSHQIKQDHR